jgi:hypothetical protein
MVSCQLSTAALIKNDVDLSCYLRLHRQHCTSEELDLSERAPPSIGQSAHLRAYESFFTLMPVQVAGGVRDITTDAAQLPLPPPPQHSDLLGVIGSGSSPAPNAADDDVSTQRAAHDADGARRGQHGARFVMCNVGTLARCVTLQSGITRVLAHVAHMAPDLLRSASSLWTPLCRQLTDAPLSLRGATLDAMRVLLSTADNVDVDVHVILPPLLLLLDLCPKHAGRLAIDRYGMTTRASML